MKMKFAKAAAALTAVCMMAPVNTYACINLEQEMVATAKNIAANDKNGFSKKRMSKYGYDNSSLVSRSALEAGLYVRGNETTKTLKKALEATGFKATAYKKTGLKKGDVLLTPNKFVAIYVGGGKIVAAYRDYDHKAGDSTNKEIAVKKLGNRTFTYRLRNSNKVNYKYATAYVTKLTDKTISYKTSKKGAVKKADLYRDVQFMNEENIVTEKEFTKQADANTKVKLTLVNGMVISAKTL